MKLGVSYTWMSRRVNGRLSMSIDDMELIENATGISAAYLVTGVNAENRHPDHPNGETCSLCTPRDLNPEPTVSSSAESAEASTPNNVVRLTPAPISPYNLDGIADVLSFPTPALIEEVDAR